jgi:hypothetical protein
VTRRSRCRTAALGRHLDECMTFFVRSIMVASIGLWTGSDHSVQLSLLEAELQRVEVHSAGNRVPAPSRLPSSHS